MGTRPTHDANWPKQGVRRAYTITEFCSHYAIGRTKAYAELKSGRLRARKIGRRTIITEDDAEDWLRELPTLRAAS